MSSLVVSSFRHCRGNVVFLVFLILWIVVPCLGSPVDKTNDVIRDGYDKDALHNEDGRRTYSTEKDVKMRRNLRSNKHKHKHKHSHSARSQSSTPSNEVVTQVTDNAEAKAAYATEKLRRSQIESSRTDKKPLNLLYTEEVVLLFEALHVYNCAPIIRYNHIEGENLIEIDNALELQKIGIQIPTSDANIVYQVLNDYSLMCLSLPMFFFILSLL